MNQNTEQKVRTRDEQAADLTVSIRAWGRSSAEAIYPMVERHIAEAEARGAAEQRRKDAEGCAIAGYVPDNTPNSFSASEAKYASTALHREPFPGDVPVYYTPAYVAWREERVKALEETLRRIADSEVFCGSQTLRHMARAALTREGGTP